MQESEEIKAIEEKLKRLRVTKRDFFALADVSASTWHRIKNDVTEPNGATMRKIRAAIVGLEAKE